MRERIAGAERLADRRPGDAQWPWVFAFASAKAARYESSAWRGDLSAARSVYTAAIPSMTTPKPQALAKIEYAQLLAHTGHHDEAATLGGEALRVGKQHGSERIISNIRNLRSKIPAQCEEVEDLDHMLITLYDEDQW